MGGTTSSYAQSDNSCTTSKLNFLIGDLTHVGPVSRRVFDLAKQFLIKNSEDQTDDKELNTGKEPHEISSPDFKLFKPLHNKKPLYFGQTYIKWKGIQDVQNLYAFCAPARMIMYLQPIDEFPSFITEFRLPMKGISLGLFELLQAFCQIYFSNIDCQLLHPISSTSKEWKIRTRVHDKTQQTQQYVHDYFPYLQGMLPQDGICILGITWTDLYPSETLNFVLGESLMNSRSAVFCFGRFEPSIFGTEEFKEITDINGDVLWKMLRVISHETSHLLGLEHCTFFQCAMNESRSVKEALAQPLFMCPVCLRKLQTKCGFVVEERYKDLLQFLQSLQDVIPNQKFEESIDWLQMCLNYLLAFN